MSSPIADALFEALANGLWRGGLLVIVAALLLRFFKRTTAAERYAVWLAMLTVIALAPAVEVAVRSMEPSDAAAPLAVMEPGLSADWAPGAGEPEIEPRQQAVEAAPGPFLLLWLAVGVLFAVRLGRRCLMAAELKRNSTAPEAELADAVKAWERDLTARRVGATRVSLSLRSPAAVGWLSPAVLLPESAEDEVASDDLEMLWRHEQAHVARRDDWTQLWAEALFAAAWFHPAAYWVRRQLEKERELACDETVLDDGVPAHRYAGALGRWAERAATNELPAGVMGLGRSRALIIRRIEMLLSPSRILRRHSGGAVFGISLTLAVAAAGLLIFGGPTAIRAQSVVAPEVVVDVAQPVVAAPTVQPEVRIGVPAPVLRVDVQVEPVLLSQAAPPTPPSPQANPAPSAAPGPPAPPTPPRPSAAPMPPVPPVPPTPSAAPVPPTPPVPPARGREQSREFREQARVRHEQARRWREELRPELDEIQREAQRLQEYVRESVRPQQEKIQAAAQKLAEEHRKSIAPFAQQMAELGARMGQVLDSEQREALQKQMQEVAARMEERQPELKRLEEEMGRLQIDMGPFEERMKELSQALSKKHQEFEEARRKLKEANQ